MKQILFSIFAVTAVFAALAASPQAQRVDIGALYSHRAELRYDLPIEVDPNGKPRGPKEFIEARSHLAVPDFYGHFVGVTQEGAKAILWYADAGGTIRNVVIDGAGSVPLAIEQRETSHVTMRVAR